MRFYFLTAFLFFFINSANSQHKIDDHHIITSDGVSLFYNVGGKGPVCIFLHGGPGAWSLSFEKMGGDVLEKHMKMYYFDQRGSGRSSSPQNNDFSPFRLADDIEQVRKLSGAEKVYLIAHSFGGILAVEYASRYPQNLKGLILLNCTLNITQALHNQIEFINQKAGSHIPFSNPDSIIQSFFAARKILRDKGLDYIMLSDKESTVARLDSIDNSLDRNNSFASHVLSTSTYFRDFATKTSKITVPVLVISGTKDHSIGPNYYKSFRFPHQKTKIIEGGHMLYYENNNEFEKLVVDFIK